MLLTSLIPGPKDDPIIDVPKCGAVEWSFKALLVIICILCTFFAGRHVLAEERLKERLGYKFDVEDVRWTIGNFFYLGFASLFCGALAAALGIGGGVLYNPLLLLLGVNPQVAASSCMYILFYNTLSTVIQLIIVERLPIVWSLWLAIFVIFFSMIGIFVINREVKRSGRQSMIVLILGFFVLVSALVTPLFSFLTMTGKAYNLWEFGSVC